MKKYEVAIPYHTEPTPVRKGGKRKHCIKEKRKTKGNNILMVLSLHCLNVPIDCGGCSLAALYRLSNILSKRLMHMLRIKQPWQVAEDRKGKLKKLESAL